MNATSKKRPRFAALFRIYVRHRLRREFSVVRMHGLDELRRRTREEPFILACNHVAWWDPLLLLHLDGLLSGEARCLMNADHLGQLPFFAWLGAVPVNRTSPVAAYRDLEAAAGWLRQPGRILALFPQGRQSPARAPVRSEMGVEFLARKTGLPVVPMALSYDFGEEPKPEVSISAGPALFRGSESKREFARRVGDALTTELGRIDEHLLYQRSGFDVLMQRKSERLPSGTRALGVFQSSPRRVDGGIPDEKNWKGQADD